MVGKPAGTMSKLVRVLSCCALAACVPWVYALEAVAVYDQRTASAGRVVSFSWRAETYRAVPRHKKPDTSKSVTIGCFRCLRNSYQRKEDAAKRQQGHGGPHGAESATGQQPRKDACIPLHALETLFAEILFTPLSILASRTVTTWPCCTAI